MGFSRVLVISDLHVPVHHQDTIPFLKALKEFLEPDKVVLTGDEVDMRTMSFHERDPDMPFSPSDELEVSIQYMKEFYELFPEADVLESNHGSMIYRKGKHHGIPRRVFKSYAEVLEAPPGWQWHDDLVIPTSDGRETFFTHGRSAKGMDVSKAEEMNSVQGHYHTKFDIEYRVTNSGKLYWAMTVGCLIDHKSMAFLYNKQQLKRPILGVGTIINGHPKLWPMLLDKYGRWTGELV